MHRSVAAAGTSDSAFPSLHDSSIAAVRLLNIERRVRNPSWTTVLAIAKALRVKPSELMAKAEQERAGQQLVAPKKRSVGDRSEAYGYCVSTGLSPALAASRGPSTLSAALGADMTKLCGMAKASGLVAEVNAKFAASLSPKVLEVTEEHVTSKTIAGSLGSDVTKALGEHLASKALAGSLSAKVTQAFEEHFAKTTIAGIDASIMASLDKAVSARVSGGLGEDLHRLAAQAVPVIDFSALLGEKNFPAFQMAGDLGTIKPKGSTNPGSTLGPMDLNGVRVDLARVQRAIPADFGMVAGKNVSPPDWVGAGSAREMLGARAVVVGKEHSRPSRPRELDDRAPVAYNALVSLEPAADDVVISAEAVSVGEEIAARVLREQKDEVVAFLEDCDLGQEVAELETVENRLHQRTERDRQYAAFAARLLLKAIADRVFPARAELWVDRQGEPHDVGPEKVANRLSAFVHDHLGSGLDKHERRAFQADLDAVADWAGGGPHGVHTTYAAEIAFGRLMNVLVHVARAFRAS